jgi:hypothetical protein
MRKCYLKRDYLLDSEMKHLDVFGFIVLNDKPDSDDTIPTQRISDGQYGCLPMHAIQFDKSPDYSAQVTLVDGLMFADQIQPV